MNKTILELAEKDLTALQSGTKSYELLNWLREEVILRKHFKKPLQFELEARSISKIIGTLSYLREKGLLTKCDISLLDTKAVKVKFDVDMLEVNNGERYRLNAKYNAGLEEIHEEKKDVTYAHFY